MVHRSSGAPGVQHHDADAGPHSSGDPHWVFVGDGSDGDGDRLATSGAPDAVHRPVGFAPVRDLDAADVRAVLHEVEVLGA